MVDSCYPPQTKVTDNFVAASLLSRVCCREFVTVCVSIAGSRCLHLKVAPVVANNFVVIVCYIGK